MPLPPALAARLAKRGLIDAAKVSEPSAQEEVFVEQYDDPSDDSSALKAKHEHNEQDKDEENEEAQLIHEVTNCPNKSNKYHECVDYCKEKYGIKKFSPETNMLEKKTKVLKKYPLPQSWLEVADPGTNRFYYWNTVTDQVSWLPPYHPRARVGPPADKIKDYAKSDGSDSDSSASDSESSGSDSESDKSDESDHEEPMKVDEDFEKLEREMLRERQRRVERAVGGDDRRGQAFGVDDRRGGTGGGDDRRGGAGGGRRRRQRDELDPMDPASYSEVPRGTWSTGLEKPGSAKTGVDATAAGPLFQQRPYPSPGAVLRMNQGKD